MSISISLPEKSAPNRMPIIWDRWPTNRFTLIPEVWVFKTDRDRLWLGDAVRWRKSGALISSGVISSRHGKYAFRWELTLREAEDALAIALAVENIGRIALPALFHLSSCLSFEKVTDFMDSNGESTFFITRAGWRSMDAYRRPQALLPGHDPYHILAEGIADPRDQRRVANAHARSSLCVRVGRNRRFCVGYAWDAPLRIDLNNNLLHCMHSSARLGPLAPGGQILRHGKIYFVTGTKDKIRQKMRVDGLV